MRVGSLCTGYGGLEMGLELAGEQVDVAWIAETGPTAALPHFAGIANLGDMTAIDWTTVERVDMVTAGFPCQPVSVAGRQRGQADERWLWPHVRNALDTLRPSRFLLENVRNLVSIQKGALWAGILDDLGQLGYNVRWLTLGACHVGAAHHRHRVFALAVQVGYDTDQVERVATSACGAKGMVMVPTTTRTDAKDSRNLTAQRRTGVSSGGTTLGDFARLLPSPRARDGDGRGEGDSTYWANRGAERTNGMPLGAALALLPTPRATDGVNGGPGQRGSSGDLAMPSAVQAQNWDRFADAVARHAAIYGDPPAPTEPNRNGAPRLSAAFAEWLMCLPAGHVTDHLPRNQALAAIGNGVCPPQAAAAYRLLSGEHMPPLDTSLGQSVASPTMTETHEPPVAQVVGDIQARQAAYSQRVIDAGGLCDHAVAEKLSAFETTYVIKAALLEIAACWREEAAIFDASSRRGAKTTAKEYVQAAARLAGFATALKVCDHPQGALSTSPKGVTRCTACQTVISTTPGPQDLPTLAEFTGALKAGLADAAASAIDDALPLVEATHHEGDVPVQPISPFSAPSPPAELLNIVSDEPVAVTLPSPFVTPAPPGRNRPPVTRLRFADLGELAAKTYPVARANLSHSFVEDMESCGLKAMLRDASRHEQIGAARPSWSLVGGTAIHAAINAIERAALELGGASPNSEFGWEKFWNETLQAEIDERVLALAGSPYADLSTWHVPNKGLEGFDWWRVKGADMIATYLKVHDDAWRASHVLLQVPAIRTNVATPGALVPVLEFEFNEFIAGTDITAKGYVDAAWVAHPATVGPSQYPTAAIEVVDFKSGAREPSSPFQLAQYADVLRRHYLPANFALPIYGRHYLARRGIYTPPVLLDSATSTDEIAYRYSQAQRAHRAGVVIASPSSFCSGCGFVDYCPTQTSRDAS